MRVCLISSQVFAWGKHGGLGVVSRNLIRGLIERGIEVCVVTPRRGEMKERERLDGAEVLSFTARQALTHGALYNQCDADIYHSQEPSLQTWVAMKAMPDRKHIITAYDPRFPRDWWTEFKYLSGRRKPTFPVTYLYEVNPCVKRAARRAHKVYVQAAFLAERVKARYAIEEPVSVLASPVGVPERQVRKARQPTVCFVGRWDGRKRPELFVELAEKRPEVRFVMVGEAHDPARDRVLRSRCARVPNIELVGFIDQFTSDGLWEVLERSWILVNTSAREGLPISFLEAAACECAVLSSVDPGGFTTRFGYRAADEDFDHGLAELMRNDTWRRKGKAARGYVVARYGKRAAIDAHLRAYENAVQDAASSGIDLPADGNGRLRCVNRRQTMGGML